MHRADGMDGGREALLVSHGGGDVRRTGMGKATHDRESLFRFGERGIGQRSCSWTQPHCRRARPSPSRIRLQSICIDGLRLSDGSSAVDFVGRS